MRKTIVLVHLYLAAFVAPLFLLVAISGGLHLLGVKEQVVSTEIPLPEDATLEFSSSSVGLGIDALLERIDVDHPYQYLKNSGDVIQTRPTSRTYLEFTKKNGVLTLTRKAPSWQKSLIELHKGHGPTAFRTYQKGVAASLIFIVLSGLWLGLSSPSLRSKALPTAIAGLAVFLALALF